MAPVRMPNPAVKPERIIALIAGESGTGKSFAVANLKKALIFDTDLGGGLSYLDARIARNGSERIEVGTYQEVMREIEDRRRSGRLRHHEWIGIDHLTALQQEAAIRHNPSGAKDFGSAGEKAAKEWRRIRQLVRVGDFHLVCTAHLKSKWEKETVVGVTTDASKNINADFSMVLYLQKQAGGNYPSVARVEKWRRDPDDARGQIPPQFPFTMEKLFEIHGQPLDVARAEMSLATNAQVAEILELLDVVKIPEAEIDKWKKKDGADDWADFTAENLAKCIAFVRSKLPRDRQPGEGG